MDTSEPDIVLGQRMRWLCAVVGLVVVVSSVAILAVGRGGASRYGGYGAAVRGGRGRLAGHRGAAAGVRVLSFWELYRRLTITVMCI